MVITYIRIYEKRNLRIDHKDREWKKEKKSFKNKLHKFSCMLAKKTIIMKKFGNALREEEESVERSPFSQDSIENGTERN